MGTLNRITNITNDQERYLEIAGFPHIPKKGTATEAALQEVRGRAFLVYMLGRIEKASWTADKQKVRERREERLALCPHSTHYNAVLNPMVQITEDGKRLDLSRAKTRVPLDNHKEEESTHATKFVADFAQVAMHVFGPAYSLLLTGSHPTYVCFKVREGNRFEYRNSALTNAEQYQAGMLLFTAGSMYLLKKIKEKIITAAADALNKKIERLTQGDIDGIYPKITLEELLAEFPIALTHVPIVRPDTRTGYKIAETGYHTQLEQDRGTRLEVKLRNGQKMHVTADQMVQILYADEDFNGIVQKLATDEEYQLLMKYSTGMQPLEIEQRDRDELSETTLRKNSGRVLEDKKLSELICDRSLSEKTWGHTYESLFLSNAYTFEETRGNTRIQLRIGYNYRTPVTLSSIPCSIVLQCQGEKGVRTLQKKRVIDLEHHENLRYIQGLIKEGIPLAEVYTLL